MWKGHRIYACAISPDGQRLICATTEKKIIIYDYATREEERVFQLPHQVTCLNISKDSRYMLVNLASSASEQDTRLEKPFHEIQLLDIETASIVKSYSGHTQGNFIIRSSFGGANENFVVSGSEGTTSILNILPFIANMVHRRKDLHMAARQWQELGNSKWAPGSRERGGLEPS
jgi:WD repeat-containing protein 26